MYRVDKTDYRITIMLQHLVISNFAKDLESAKRQRKIMLFVS